MTDCLPRQATMDAPSGGSRDWRSQCGQPTKILALRTGTRVFCGTCGSSLGGRDERWPDFIVVNAGTLDDDPGTRPLYHIYVGSKAPWFTITDSLTQFATAVEHEG